MKFIKLAFWLLLSYLCCGEVGFAQDKSLQKILFWNLENYYDPFDDPISSDEEFTPEGARHWTWRRFIKKRDDIAKVITAICGDEKGRGDMPVVIGLCEVENRMVLHQLTEKTHLSRIEYGVVHRESRDRRGIDVAMLYMKSRFKLLKEKFYDVQLPDTADRTRPILYVKGIIDRDDTVHIFVNHLPSKFGGEAISTPKRAAVILRLKCLIDSILKINRAASVIVTGDFNDTPKSAVMRELSILHNLSEMGSLSHTDKTISGTIKYKGEWEQIDQFLVSDNLLSRAVCKIVVHDYILERDKEYLGVKPRRTYIGPRYNGGISDHLPILLTIYRGSNGEVHDDQSRSS